MMSKESSLGMWGAHEEFQQRKSSLLFPSLNNLSSKEQQISGLAFPIQISCHSNTLHLHESMFHPHYLFPYSQKPLQVGVVAPLSR